MQSQCHAQASDLRNRVFSTLHSHFDLNAKDLEPFWSNILKPAGMGGRKHFIPLESNPEVMTTFARNLGAELEGFGFTDVWGLDPVSYLPRFYAPLLKISSQLVSCITRHVSPRWFSWPGTAGNG